MSFHLLFVWETGAHTQLQTHGGGTAFFTSGLSKTLSLAVSSDGSSSRTQQQLQGLFLTQFLKDSFKKLLSLQKRVLGPGSLNP